MLRQVRPTPGNPGGSATRLADAGRRSPRGLNADAADTADTADTAEAAGRTQAICVWKLRRGRRWRLPPFPALLPAPFLAPYQHAGNRALVWPASAIYREGMATGIVILRKG